jgi:hypothetical protein
MSPFLKIKKRCFGDRISPCTQAKLKGDVSSTGAYSYRSPQSLYNPRHFNHLPIRFNEKSISCYAEMLSGCIKFEIFIVLNIYNAV